MINKKMILCITSFSSLIGFSASISAIVDCNKSSATFTTCNKSLSDAKQILDCIQAGKIFGRASGVGSMDDKPMYADYVLLTTLDCPNTYSNIGYLPMDELKIPIVIDPKLNFTYYHGIVYNKLDIDAKARARTLFSAYTSGEIKDQKALVFIQNALMGFACDPLTKNPATKKIVTDWAEKNKKDWTEKNTGDVAQRVIKTLNDHCR
ncbi:MAG: hypothetical protein P4L31_02995 [Candidatus Babeliales bacterium]|nr:hypothetical protein [Candidatus Babeliales bacterium]